MVTKALPRALLQGTVMLICLALAGILFVLTYEPFGALPFGSQPSRAKTSSGWDGHSFANPQPDWVDVSGGLYDLVAGPELSDVRPLEAVKFVPTDPAVLALPPVSGLRVTWFGHASALLEIDGSRILIDPVWSETASPFTSIGPQRWFPPTIALDKLPPIDAVVISHDHYDHLDHGTVKAMRGWNTVFVVPLGLGAHLRRWGISSKRIQELDWWEMARVAKLEITATPARHATGRLSWATNTVLWSGFAMTGPRHRVWYSGDSSFHEGLQEIGSRLGPFDVTLVDVGQYNQHWPDSHLGPEQAVLAHHLVRGERMVPVHWGLFNLAPHRWTDPVERTIKAAECWPARLLVLRPGEPIEPTLGAPAAHWWRGDVHEIRESTPLVSTLDGNPSRRYQLPACW